MGAPKWPPNPRRSSPPAKPWAPRYRLERETGFEPATPSLEGWRSTAELFPPLRVTYASTEMVGRGGFEPPKAYASRFTVCPLWSLGYLLESAGTRYELLEKDGVVGWI